jgi:hypothetical protein
MTHFSPQGRYRWKDKRRREWKAPNDPAGMIIEGIASIIGMLVSFTLTWLQTWLSRKVEQTMTRVERNLKRDIYHLSLEVQRLKVKLKKHLEE